MPGEENNITSKVDKKMKNWDNGFKIGHVNIRSLVKNIDQLRIYLSNQQYDIICINETWLDIDDKINNYEVSIHCKNKLVKMTKKNWSFGCI